MALHAVKPISFVFPVDNRGYVNPKNFHEFRNGEDLNDGPFIVDYHFEKGCHMLSAGMWYSSGGRFELVVNQCSQDTALRMFALAINEEHRSESEEPHENVRFRENLHRVVIIYPDGWELLSRRFDHRSQANEWVKVETKVPDARSFMVVEDENANTKYIRSMIYDI